MKKNMKWEETKKRLAEELAKLANDRYISRKWGCLRPTVEENRVYLNFSHKFITRFHRDIYFIYEPQTDSVICRITRAQNMMQKLKWVNKAWINKCISKLKEELQDV